jgi:hypothetical protein
VASVVNREQDVFFNGCIDRGLGNVQRHTLTCRMKC